MARPVKAKDRSGQAYPTLEQFACERREFLQRLALGAISIGVGGRLLSACTSTTELSGIVPEPDLFAIRLPAEGFASAYLGRGSEYLRFAVRLTTENEALASYYRAAEAEGTGVASGAIAPFSCSEVADPAMQATIQASLIQALDANYDASVDDPGPRIRTLSLEVESCEYIGGPDGGVDMPEYP